MTSKKCPSTRRTFFFLLAASSALLSFPETAPALDYVDEKERLMKGTITALRDDYIALSQGSGGSASEFETPFFRKGEFELVNVDHWHQLKEGQPAIIRYRERLSVHEYRDDKGGTVYDTKLLGRDLLSIEVPAPPEEEAKAEAEEDVRRPPGMLQS